MIAHQRRHILVVGTGSAGQRHARNLRSLGCSVACFDPRPDRLDEAAAAGTLHSRYIDFSSALEAHRWDGVVIASPPHAHVDQITGVIEQLTCPVLSEKPLSIDLEPAKTLRKSGDRILLGYTYRWWEPLRVLRDDLRRGRIGELRSLRFVMSAHLADWHPWERYQEFFMSQASLGGGALLDESHFIDLMLWFGVRPRVVSAMVDKISSLELDADDNVEIMIRGEEGVRVNLHLDLIGRPHERSITAVGELGTLSYAYEDNSLRFAVNGSSEWDVRTYSCERNDMFVGAAREFLELIDGTLETKTCTVEDGIRALQVVEACRESSRTGRHVEIQL